MNEVPLYDEGFACEISIDSRSCISEGIENPSNGLKGFCLEAKAGIWPWLSCLCHIRSTAESSPLNNTRYRGTSLTRNSPLF
jgi:hypothetical protein